MNPRNGLSHCDHSGCQVWRNPLRWNHVPKLGVVVDPDQVAVLTLPGAVVEQVGHHEAQLHVAGRVRHPLERLEIGVPAVGHARRGAALVVSVLVPGEKVDPEKRRAELTEVGDVALDVFLGSVAGGVHPLQGARRPSK